MSANHTPGPWRAAPQAQPQAAAGLTDAARDVLLIGDNMGLSVEVMEVRAGAALVRLVISNGGKPVLAGEPKWLRAGDARSIIGVNMEIPLGVQR